MMRRRRRTREIPFSFDSFLDVVANVVGIIIRLILVVWVGARSYSSLSLIGTKPARPNEREKLQSVLPDDPLQAELALRRRELERAQMELLEQLRKVDDIRGWETNVQSQFAELVGRRERIKKERAALDQEATAKEGAAGRLSFSLAEVRERQQKLVAEITPCKSCPRPDTCFDTEHRSAARCTPTSSFSNAIEVAWPSSTRRRSWLSPSAT